MRGLRASAPAVALVAFAAGGCAARSHVELGRTVTLVPVEAGAAKVKGELLVVDDGRIWVRTEDGVRDVEAASLREVRVRRHGYTGGWAVRWGLVGGLLSGGALTASCASVKGNDTGGCAGFGVGAAALWALMGFLAAPSLDASSQLSVDPESARLKPYARLPAGLPEGVSPGSLLEGPPAPVSR